MQRVSKELDSDEGRGRRAERQLHDWTLWWSLGPCLRSGVQRHA